MKQFFLLICIIFLSACSLSIEKNTPNKTQNTEGEKELEKSEKIFPQTYDGIVRIKTSTVIDPRGLMQDKDIKDKITFCQQQIDAGNDLTGCPTQKIISLIALDHIGFPQVFHRVNIDTLLDVGCIDEQGSLYGSPVRGYAEFNTIISEKDQSTLLKKADSGETIQVSITKNDSTIIGRGASNCDIYFSKLNIIE